MKLKIFLLSGQFCFKYNFQIMCFETLADAIYAAQEIVYRIHQLRMNIYTHSGVVLHA